ncbi:MAG: RNA polymerase sigma factor [Actinomycetota bacterium]
MSETGSHMFEEQWPELARRLDAMLAGKRVPAHKRDDIVQETGLRLFRMWDQVDPERPLWALVVTIALNLLRDEARKRPEREVLGLLPDRPADQDVERAGLARLEWRRVQNAMNQLSPAHRSILLAELGDEPAMASRGANATKMLRMRARRRLSALLDVASASGMVFGLRLRRLFDLERHVVAVRTLLSQTENVAAPAAAGFLSAVALFAAAAGPLAGDAGAGLLGRRGASDGVSGLASASLAAATDTGGAAGAAAARSAGTTSNRRAGRAGRNLGVVHAPGDKSAENKPIRAGAGDHFVEGAADVGVLGYGVRVGDRGYQTPACVSSGTDLLLPPDAFCSKGETREGVHVRLRVGSDEHNVEVRVDVE